MGQLCESGSLCSLRGCPLQNIFDKFLGVVVARHGKATYYEYYMDNPIEAIVANPEDSIDANVESFFSLYL